MGKNKNNNAKDIYGSENGISEHNGVQPQLKKQQIKIY